MHICFKKSLDISSRPLMNNNNRYAIIKPIAPESQKPINSKLWGRVVFRISDKEKPHHNYCFLKLHKEYWELNYSRCLDLVHFHMICSSEFLHKTELTTAEMTKQRVYSFLLWNFRSSDAYFHISMKLKTKIEKTKLSTTENAKECL